jgi:hypothetical protein
MTDSGEHEEQTLVLAFDSDDPEFARGFEAGVLWQRMGVRTPFVATIHATNTEMVMRMADVAHRTFSAHELDDLWTVISIDEAT